MAHRTNTANSTIALMGTTSAQSYVSFRAGVRSQQAGHYDAAEGLYRQALAHDPRNRFARANLLALDVLRAVAGDALRDVTTLLRQAERALVDFLAESEAGGGRPVPDEATLTASYYLVASKAYRAEWYEQTGSGSGQKQESAVFGSLETAGAMNERILQGIRFLESAWWPDSGLSLRQNGRRLGNALRQVLPFQGSKKRARLARLRYLDQVGVTSQLVTFSLMVRMLVLLEALGQAETETQEEPGATTLAEKLLALEAGLAEGFEELASREDLGAYEIAAYHALRYALHAAQLPAEEGAGEEEGTEVAAERQRLRNAIGRDEQQVRDVLLDVLWQSEEAEQRLLLDPRLHGLRRAGILQDVILQVRARRERAVTRQVMPAAVAVPIRTQARPASGSQSTAQ